MQRIEAGADLHALDFVHGLARGKVDTCFFETGTSVREVVLNDQIFAFLRVDERGSVRETVFGQNCGYGSVRTGRDLVDHRPGEGNGCGEPLPEALIAPCIGKAVDRRFQFVAVVGAVVHADHGDRGFAAVIAGEKERGEFPHVGLCVLRCAFEIRSDIGQQFSFRVTKRVAFLGDGKGGHLETRFFKDFGQTCFIAVKEQFFGDGADHGFLDSPFRLQRHFYDQIVVDFRFLFAALYGNDAGIRFAVIQQTLAGIGLEGLENVACSEVDPFRLGGSFRNHGFTVISGQTISFCLPLCSVFQSFIRENHLVLLFILFPVTERCSV